MNNDIVKGKWREIKGKLKEQWGKLTDDDIQRMEGSFESFSGQIQKRYGYEKDQCEKEIKTFFNKNGWDK